jgi:hypothetical protein
MQNVAFANAKGCPGCRLLTGTVSHPVWTTTSEWLAVESSRPARRFNPCHQIPCDATSPDSTHAQARFAGIQFSVVRGSDGGVLVIPVWINFANATWSCSAEGESRIGILAESQSLFRFSYGTGQKSESCYSVNAGPKKSCNYIATRKAAVLYLVVAESPLRRELVFGNPGRLRLLQHTPFTIYTKSSRWLNCNLQSPISPQRLIHSTPR